MLWKVAEKNSKMSSYCVKLEMEKLKLDGRTEPRILHLGDIQCESIKNEFKIYKTTISSHY